MINVDLTTFTVFDPDNVQHDSLLVGGARPNGAGQNAPLQDATFELGKLVAYLQARSTTGGVVYLQPTQAEEVYDPSSHVDWQNVRRVSVLANTVNFGFSLKLPEAPLPGDVVNLISYGDHFEDNPVVIDPGVEVIDGQTTDITVNLPGVNLTIIYISQQVGWAIIPKGDTLVVNTAVTGWSRSPIIRVTEPTAAIPSNFINGTLILDTQVSGQAVEIVLPNKDYLPVPWGFKVIGFSTPSSLVFTAGQDDTVIGAYASPAAPSQGVIGDVCYLGSGVFATPS